MEIVIFFVLACVYVIIGGICAGIFDWTDEDDATAFMILFWPVIAPIICLRALALCSMHTVEKIISWSYKIKLKRRKTK